MKGQRKRANAGGKRWVEDRKEAVKEMNGGVEVVVGGRMEEEKGVVKRSYV